MLPYFYLSKTHESTLITNESIRWGVTGKKKCRNWTEIPAINWLGWLVCQFLYACLWQVCKCGTWRLSLKRRSSYNYSDFKVHPLLLYNFFGTHNLVEDWINCVICWDDLMSMKTVLLFLVLLLDVWHFLLNITLSVSK